MSQQNLNSDPQTDIEDTKPPVQAALSNDVPPVSDGEEKAPQGSSWEEENAKLSQAEDEPQDNSATVAENRILKLEKQIEDQMKAIETAEKRQKDSQRAFRDSATEVKRLQKEREVEKENVTPKPESPEPKTETEASDLEEIAPLSDEEMDELQEKNGWTQSDREHFEVYPERISTIQRGIERGLSSQLDAELSRREEAKERQLSQSRIDAESKTQDDSDNDAWLRGVEANHPNAGKTMKSEDFRAWAQANEGKKDYILNRKDKYDPSGATEVLDLYESDRGEREEREQAHEFRRQSMSRPQSVGGNHQESNGEKSWDQMNADVKKARS